MLGSVPRPELLAAYNEIDIGLDPFPYSGGVTTLEAIWMGVPVSALRGPLPAVSHSVSHLTNIGVKELLAATTEEYVQATLELASNTQRLQDYRQRLREMMRNSPICDARGFTEQLEFAYRQMLASKSK